VTVRSAWAAIWNTARLSFFRTLSHEAHLSRLLSSARFMLYRAKKLSAYGTSLFAL
jgi:hypothetical protein